MTTQFTIGTFLVLVTISVPIAWIARIPALKQRAIRSHRFRIILTLFLGFVAGLIVYLSVLRVLASGIALEYRFTDKLSHELWLQMLAMSTHCFSDNARICELATFALPPGETWRKAVLLALSYSCVSVSVAAFFTWRFTSVTTKLKRDATYKAKREHPISG